MVINREFYKNIIGKRSSASHKGNHGRVLIIAGSCDYVGAPILSANAALSVLRTGADIVTIASPSKVAWAINALSPDIITKKLNGDYFSMDHFDEVSLLIDDFDIFLIGPGIGYNEETILFCQKIISSSNIPKIIDADAIKSINLHQVSNAVLTPHKKELDILLMNSGIKIRKYEELADYLKDNVIIIKGEIDTIISRDRIEYNESGNAGMTVGGTGDVLAGLVTGIAVQGDNLFDSACGATYLNGRVGDRLFKKFGNQYIASDFINEIPKELNSISE